MLSDRKGLQSSIKGAPSARDDALVSEELEIVRPDAWHLVHEDKAALEAVVDVLARWIVGAQGRNITAPLAQVLIPELVAGYVTLIQNAWHRLHHRIPARHDLQCSLVDLIASRWQSLALGLQIAQPCLELKGITQQLLFVGDIILGEVELGHGNYRSVARSPGELR